MNQSNEPIVAREKRHNLVRVTTVIHRRQRGRELLERYLRTEIRLNVYRERKAKKEKGGKAKTRESGAFVQRSVLERWQGNEKEEVAWQESTANGRAASLTQKSSKVHKLCRGMSLVRGTLAQPGVKYGRNNVCS